MLRISNRAILIFILGVSVVLRFYRFTEIPFMHDEFSALFRTDFDSFNELIKNGVMPDGHPALVQVFLFYWIRLFGSAEWIVKLPFAVMGVLSVLLVYLIGRRWYNETAGLIASAFLAATQYMVMYSQIARPYITGLFFSLLMVFCWSKLMEPTLKSYWRYGVCYIAASALCAYNHHFSLLFAALTGISGLFFVRRKYMLQYLLSGILIFVLYIPHLGIFIHQLNTGGVGGWLGKPDDTFFLNYLYYTFNFSLASVLLTAALILFGLYHLKSSNFSYKAFILFAAWFLIPLITGYWYSKNVNPVLQYSVLIFSYFPLLFLLFGHIPEKAPKTNLVLVVIILAVTIYGLIIERKHYRIFYNSAFERIVTDYIHADEYNRNMISLVDSHKKITTYYLKKYDADSSFIWFDTFPDEAEFIKFLKQAAETNELLYFGALSSNKPNTVPIIRQYFPVILRQSNYFLGTTWLFSRNGDEMHNNITEYNFDSPVPEGWRSVNPDNIKESTGIDNSCSYEMDSLIEWSPTFTIPLNQVMVNENNFIDVMVKAEPENQFTEVFLITTLESEGEVVQYSGADFSSFTGDTINSGEWITVCHSLKLADVNLNYNNILLNVYVWNKGLNRFLLDDFRIEVRDGNPFIYGLYENLP